MTTIIESTKWRRCYKLTDSSGETKNHTKWGMGIKNPVGILKGERDLCTSDWYHAYESPEYASIFNQLGANFNPAMLWLAEWRGKKKVERTKIGATELRTIKQIQEPVISKEAIFAWSLRLLKLKSKEVFAITEDKGESWIKWADNWINKVDRTEETAKSIHYCYNYNYYNYNYNHYYIQGLEQTLAFANTKNALQLLRKSIKYEASLS